MNHEEAIKEWDLVIEPHNRLFSLNLKDVWRYRDLLALLVKRDIVSVYKQTVLGPVWFFIQPLMTTITFVFIFGNLAAISTDGLPQPLFYMCGIIAWNYFSDCLTKTSSVFRDNANIFGKVYFPRLVMPLSLVVSNLMKFGIQFLLLIVVLLYYILFKDFNFQFRLELLAVPFLIIDMAILALGIGMIISALTTKYRDLVFLVSFGMSLFMYATPVIYPLSAAPEKYRYLLELNPMAPVIEGLRYALLGNGIFSVYSILYSISITSIILFAGMLVFNKVEKNFVDTV